MRGNRKWAAAAAGPLAETAAGAGPRGAGTGRGPPERGKDAGRRSGFKDAASCSAVS